MKEILAAATLFLISLAALILSIRAFCRKGFLLNNAYLYASGRERETMDKTPYYRQTAVVFLLIAIVFLLNGLSVLLETYWLSYLGTGVIFLTVLYAVVSAIRIEKRKKDPK